MIFWNRVGVRQDAFAIPGLATMPTLAAITLGAFALRLVMLDSYPFREDEAAYAYWALHGWFEDPMFLSVWPDKPPVFIWLLGGAFRLFGVSEASARWVSIAASTLTVPIVAATANRLWGRTAAIMAATVLALSPYAIAFGPTAFTDPTLVFFGLLAFCCAVYGRGFGAGIALGAAVMTKQQGLLYAPLVIGALWITAAGADGHAKRALRQVGMATVGTLLVTLPILYWDSLRWATAPSPWDIGVRNYASLAFIPAQQWPMRLRLWTPLLVDLAASRTTWAAFAALAAAGAWIVWRDLANRRFSRLRNPGIWVILLIVGWGVAYVTVHVVTTMQPWDRYLLPIAPLLALGAGWAFGQIALVARPRTLIGLAVIFLAVQAPPANAAARGQLAVGGDHGDYAGLREAIQYVQDASNGPAVLYHRELGAQLRFYLYDDTSRSAPNRRIEQRWFPSAVYLADNAAKTAYPPKYLIEPEWASIPNLAPHVAMRQLAISKRAGFERFVVWQIEHSARPPCDWCVCGQRATWLPSVLTPFETVTSD